MVQASQSDASATAAVPEPRVRTLPPGTCLGAVYRIESPIGAGAGGSVYRAIHVGLGRAFAVKVLDDADDADGAARLAREARTASAIAHPHIVDVVHLGLDGHERPFVVMELLEGEDLRARLARQGTPNRGLPLDEARTILEQAWSGLAAAHEAGVIHRDLKPANIFLAARRGTTTVKLVDFGMSRHVNGAVRVTQTGQLIGTPLYMAPEQSNGADVDARADVYALGVVAYEVLAGRVPFEAESLYECVLSHALAVPPPLGTIRPDVPVEVAAFVHRCLEKAPDARFAHAGEAARAFGDAWSNHAPRADATASWALVTPAQRWKSVLLGAIACAVLFGATASWAMHEWSRGEPLRVEAPTQPQRADSPAAARATDPPVAPAPVALREALPDEARVAGSTSHEAPTAPAPRRDAPTRRQPRNTDALPALAPR